MIWSLVKVLVFVGLAAAIAFGAGYVLDTPGEVRIAFGGRELSLTPLGGMIAVVILVALLWILIRLAGLLVAVLRFLNGDDTALSRFFDRNRERRGFDALAGGIIALASGEGRDAQAKAARAERLLSRPDLTHLLNAQAAEMAGNRPRAEEYYKKLLEDPATRFVGIRGLMQQKLAEGKTDLALKLAEKAFALRPRHEGVLDTLFALQSEAGDWAGARKTVEAKVRARALPRDVGVRREAVLALADARAAEQAGDVERAKALAAEANRAAPTLVPAAVTAARLKAADGDARGAEKMLRRAWEANPHPDLAAGFAALGGDETPAARLRRFKPLLALRPEDVETRLLGAELALAADDVPAARRALGDLAEKHPTTRSLALMAAIERASGAGEEVVRGFLARALDAPRGEQWVCGKCRHAHALWSPTCDNCGAFDTLAWTEPPRSGAGAGTSMLPLLAGSPSAGTLQGSAPGQAA